METAVVDKPKPRVSEKQTKYKVYNAKRNDGCGFQPTEADLAAIQCIYDDAPADPDNPAEAGAYSLWVRYRGAGHEQSQAIKCMAQCAPGSVLDTLVAKANQRQQEHNQYYSYANSDWYCTTQTMWYSSNLHRGAKGNARCQKRRDMMFDIDNHSTQGMTAQDIADKVDAKIKRGILPEMVVIITGRGVQLHLPIEPCNPNNIDDNAAFCVVYKAIADIITDQITSWHKELQLDSTIDNARLHRIPGTLNTGAHTYAHADPRHASVDRRNIQDIAASYGFDRKKERQKRIDAAKYNKAMAILVSVEQSKSKSGRKTTRYERALNLAEHLRVKEGKRHDTLWALCSTMLDNGGVVDYGRAQAINATFQPPLPEKDVRKIVELLNKPDQRPKHLGEKHKPIHTDTLYDMCGVDSWYDDGAGNKPQQPEDVLEPPTPNRIYSKSEIYWAIGYMLDNDYIDESRDFRKQNKTRDKERAERKAERQEKKKAAEEAKVAAKAEKQEKKKAVEAAKAAAKAEKEAKNKKARQLLADGVGYTEIMHQTGLSKGQISNLKNGKYKV